jgi:Cof subfamily protein (haloacid dehalogenase superfamily)
MALTKQPIRLLAFDLDGTLWNHSLHFDARDAQALHQAACLGIEVVPVSARPPFGIEFGLHNSEFYRFAVAYNGSLVYERPTHRLLALRRLRKTDVTSSRVRLPETLPLDSSLTGEPLAKDLDSSFATLSPNDSSIKELLNLPIPPDQATAVIDLIHQYHLYAGFYASDEFYAEIDDENARLESRSQGRNPLIVPDLSLYAGHRPNKIIVIEMQDNGRLSRFYEEATHRLPGLSFLYSTSYTIEICRSGVTKASGLRFLVERLGLQPSQVLAVGDSYNDLSMLEFAGVGVAVANAPLQVRQAADWVTGSCEEAGVAQAAARFILEDSLDVNCNE